MKMLARSREAKFVQGTGSFSMIQRFRDSLYKNRWTKAPGERFSVRISRKKPHWLQRILFEDEERRSAKELMEFTRDYRGTSNSGCVFLGPWSSGEAKYRKKWNRCCIHNRFSEFFATISSWSPLSRADRPCKTSPQSSTLTVRPF